MRQKLQNSKGYAESLEFLSAFGLFIFKKVVATNYCTHTNILYIYTNAKPNILICLLVCAGNIKLDHSCNW